MPHLPLSHCASLVRAHDHDRYLCALFAPPPVREAWFALFAFNHELAAIPELVDEEMIGFMRFAWWREALDEIYAGGPVRKHPVVGALAHVVVAHRLPRAPFDVLLEAREKKFAGGLSKEPHEWEEYFRATSSGLLALCERTAGLEPSACAESLGIIWGCVGMARMTGDAILLRMAGQRLASLPPLPEALASFRDTAEFYLKRLERGKKTGRETEVLLLLALCRRRIMRRIKSL